MKQSKKYVIYHIETGNYLKTSGLRLDWDCILISNPMNCWYVPLHLDELRHVGIEKKDFLLKHEAIYFKDIVSATSFLRDVYLSLINRDRPIKFTKNKKLCRNEFIVMEVDGRV